MFTDQTQPASEAVGILAAVLILLLAFGSLLAMGLPIMTALFGIGIGLAVVTLLARVMDIPSFAPQVTAMIGIGVGIDYALFISTRYREALHEGVDPERAVVHAIDTSGRAVLFAGGTVVISLLGLFVIGVSFIRGLAIGAVARGLVRDGRRDHSASRGARLRRAHDRPVGAAGREEEARRQQELLDAMEPHDSAPAVAGRDRRSADPARFGRAVLLAPARCRRLRQRSDASSRRVARTTCCRRVSVRASTAHFSSPATRRPPISRRPTRYAPRSRPIPMSRT